MQYKINLHLHSHEDPLDGPRISYSFKEAINEAAKLHFNALAITLHNGFGYTDELAQYAKEKNILLIPGIEETVDGRHVLILNATPEAEQVHTFDDLRRYRTAHPECFVIAPHPYYYGNFSLKGLLDLHHDLFDAIEQSWFYNNIMNRNPQAAAAAKKYNLPFIATSDTHQLRYLDNSYAMVDATELSPKAIFDAIRARRFENVSQPALFWRDMFCGPILDIFRHPINSLLSNQRWFIEAAKQRLRAAK